MKVLKREHPVKGRNHNTELFKERLYIALKCQGSRINVAKATLLWIFFYVSSQRDPNTIQYDWFLSMFTMIPVYMCLCSEAYLYRKPLVLQRSTYSFYWNSILHQYFSD